MRQGLEEFRAVMAALYEEPTGPGASGVRQGAYELLADQSSPEHPLRRLINVYCAIAKDGAGWPGYHAPALAVIDEIEAILQLMRECHIAPDRRLEDLVGLIRGHYSDGTELPEYSG